MLKAERLVEMYSNEVCQVLTGDWNIAYRAYLDPAYKDCILELETRSTKIGSEQHDRINTWQLSRRIQTESGIIVSASLSIFLNILFYKIYIIKTTTKTNKINVLIRCNIF